MENPPGSVKVVKNKTDMRSLLLGVSLVLVLIIFLATILSLLSTNVSSQPQQNSSFDVSQFGRSGNSAYVIFDYVGSGNVSLLLHNGTTSKQIFIVNDSQAVGATHLPDLIAQINQLEAYGYSVSVTNQTSITNGIYFVPTGAMPWYVLLALENNASNATIFYFGDKDLVITSQGIQQQDWFSSLSNAQQSNLIIYNDTLDNFIGQTNFDPVSDILYQNSYQYSNYSFQVFGSGEKTASLPMGNSTSNFLRVVYTLGNVSGVQDFPLPSQTPSLILSPSPSSIFPWQNTNLRFSLNRTNGTARLTVNLNGQQVENDTLQSVSDQNVFIRTLQYQTPGDYLLSVSDDSGVIGSGILHVSDLQIHFLQAQGYSYYFQVLQDGNPVANADAKVWLDNSSNSQDLYVNNGILVVNARLDQGTTNFNFDIFGSQIAVPIQNNNDSFLEFYIKYGIPGLVLIVLVFGFARLSRRPTYKLNFGDAVPYVRSEVKLSQTQAIGIFKKARSDMHLGVSPITPQEYAVEIRRSLTKGADITEGNVESVLKSLCTSGKVESHREYYQLSGEGDVQKNVLMRIVREKLIEHGIQFEEKNGKFITSNFEIGSMGDTFSKKGIIIFDDEIALRKALGALSYKDRAKLELRKSNNLLSLVTIDQLDDAL